MQPIQALLHRIEWDPEFGFAKFVVGYYDRVAKAVVKVPFEHMKFEPRDPFCFEVVDEEGVAHTIPLHRVREVYRNGELIWHRQP